MKFDNEFKNAISMLSPKEKDKLILRLLRHDPILVKQLHFELVSNDSVETRRSNMETRIVTAIERMSLHYYSSGYLLIDVRALSGKITEHVKTTRDKFGEASLNLLMLNELLKKNNRKIAQEKPAKAHTLNVYIIARAFKILRLIQSLHKDYFVEFEEKLKEVGEMIADNPLLMQMAVTNGIDVNWLIQGEIPEDIAAIHKNAREMGFLK